MTSPLPTRCRSNYVMYTQLYPTILSPLHHVDVRGRDSTFGREAYLPTPSATFPLWTSKAFSARPDTFSKTARGHAELPAEFVSCTTTPTQDPERDRFVCPEVHCGKRFRRSFALRRHMRIHTGTKPYVCDYYGCTQRFNTSGNLSRHKRIHSGERPFPCCVETCNKRFRTSTNLKRHMRVHYPDEHSLCWCAEYASAWASDNLNEDVQLHSLHSTGHENYADALDEAVTTSNCNGSDTISYDNRKAMCAVSAASMDVMQSRLEKRLIKVTLQMSPPDIFDYLHKQDRDHVYADVVATEEARSRRVEQKSAPVQHNNRGYHRMEAASLLLHKPFLNDRAMSLALPRLSFPLGTLSSENRNWPSSSVLRSSFFPAQELAPRHYNPAVPRMYFEKAASSSSNYTTVDSSTTA